MLHAHIMNITEPGYYGGELNSTLTANNLLCIKISKTPNSTKIIKILTREEEDREKGGEENSKQTQKGVRVDYNKG